jgi:phenol 2-monooxygenase
MGVPGRARVVFQQSHPELALEKMPAFLAAIGRYGLRHYEKMSCADLGGGNDIFAMREIDRKRGCMLVVRPDQYVAHVLPLDGYAEIARFFDGFMVSGDRMDVDGGGFVAETLAATPV